MSILNVCTIKAGQKKNLKKEITDKENIKEKQEKGSQKNFSQRRFLVADLHWL